MGLVVEKVSENFQIIRYLVECQVRNLQSTQHYFLTLSVEDINILTK